MTDPLRELRQVEEEMLRGAESDYSEEWAHTCQIGYGDLLSMLQSRKAETLALAACLRGAREGIAVELDSLYPLFMEARARSISIAAMTTKAERQAAWVKLAAHYDAIGAVLALNKP